MNFKYIKILVVFLIVFAQNTKGQLLEKRIDSIYKNLQDSIKIGKNKIELFKLYDYYGYLLEQNNEFDKCFENYNTILDLIKREFKNKKQDSLKAVIYLNMSYTYTSKGEKDSCIVYSNKAIQIAEKYNFNDCLVSAYGNKTNILMSNEDFEAAISQCFELKEKIEKVKDTIARNNMNQTNYLNLGNVYLKMKSWDEAEKYLLKSIEKPKTNINNKSRSFYNLSLIYSEYKEYRKALIYATKADSTIRKGYLYPYDFLNIQIQMANTSNKYGNYDDGLHNSENVLLVARDLKFNDGIGLGLILKGEALAGQKKYNKALQNLKSGYELVKNGNNPENIINAANNLGKIYEKLGDFKKANKFNKIYYRLTDSLNLKEKNRDISDAIAKYETAEKEQQITQQKLELQTKEATIANQKNTQILLLSGLGFLILGGLFFYTRNKAKQEKVLQEAVLEEKEKGFAAVIKASEDERKRISKDLHDGIGQEMAALKMAINHVKEKETDASQKEALGKIYENCSKSADGIRNISHQMMPRTLLEKGLVDALDDLLKSTFSYSDITYKFDYFDIDERFEERIEISLYRVAQELITNVVKHSKATEVNVMLYKQHNNLFFFLEDNGIGIKSESGKGHGVLNIKSRIDMVKGSINYEPSPNSGTTATIKIPL